MNKRELQLFAALTNIGDDLVEEGFAFLPARGMFASEGSAPSAPHRGRSRLLPVIGVACAAVMATGILVGVMGNAFNLFPIKPPDVTTEEVTTEEPAAESTEEVTTEEPTEESTEEETVSPVDDGVTLPLTPDAGLEYQDKIIFVGDSLTAHLINRGGLTGGKDTKQVWRCDNNMMNLNSEITSVKIIYPETGEKMTVAQAAAVAKPEIMIITLGTDWGVSYLNESEFKACYASLIQAILAESPDTRIILQSIFPVTEDCVNLDNAKIDTANGWVKDVAAGNGCRYLDTQEVLKDGEGCLKKEYCSSADGIHLNKEAYEVILAYVRTHALTLGDDTQDTPTMPETVRDALTAHTDILQSTMVSWQRLLENVTVERVMDAIERIETASEFFGATNEGGYYLEAKDGNVYLCRKIVYPILDGEEEGSQILSEFLGEKS